MVYIDMMVINGDFFHKGNKKRNNINKTLIQRSFFFFCGTKLDKYTKRHSK